LVDDLVSLGFDSIWMSEVLTAPGLDPLVALAWIAAYQPQVKLGTTMLLPGRNIVRLARQLAALDALSKGRLLVTFVPGILRSPERDVIGVSLNRRSLMEEALPVLRSLLEGESVTHHGAIGSFENVQIAPLPSQQPLEFWLGGIAAKSLEFCGRAGDGWLPSQCTPEVALAGREAIDQAASAAGRSISPEHFGVSIGYTRAGGEDTARGQRDDHRPAPLVGFNELRKYLRSLIDVGFSKFVVRPTDTPVSWGVELHDLADAVLDLQT
jgi:probable F420-dependent oxidoreductase